MVLETRKALLVMLAIIILSQIARKEKD